MTPLAENILLVTGAGANVVVLLEQDGVAMIDGGLADNSPALLALVAAQAGTRPVRMLFNTHWHADHTGSNEALGRAGATIVAHDNTRRWLSTTVVREMQNRTFPPRPKEAWPTKTIIRPETITFGATQIDVGPLAHAHTNGDLYVSLPQANVLIVSDALTVGRYPVPDYSTGGWINGTIDAAAALLLKADANTRIVPGLGPVQTKPDLQAGRDMLVAVRDRVVALIRQGKSLAEVKAAAPTRGFDARWGQPDQFLESTYIGLVRHTHELGAIL